MNVSADLHAHSAYAGGARAGGKSLKDQEKRILKRFHDTQKFTPLKGVNLIGCGDVQFEPWLDFLKKNFTENTDGIYEYHDLSSQFNNEINPKNIPKYVLQTELIFTGPVKNTKRKKRVHVLILFPNFTRVEELNQLMDRWNVARQNMARPFIVCDSTTQVSERISSIQELDPNVEIIPAHVLTPEGVYGGNERINFMKDFFGESAKLINSIETGLSADPRILGLIPELDKLTLLSNADAHSSALNRVGREFTTFNVNQLDYKSLIHSIRTNNIIKTAEFHPTEGRYFLTGHRSGRTKPGVHKNNQYCCFSPKHVPSNDICPICDKELTIGVLQRAFEICNAQGEERQIGEGPIRPFVTTIPLIEIIAFSLKIKSITSKAVFKEYSNIISLIENEVNLWINDITIKQLQESSIEREILENIVNVRNGNFCFLPGGYDGTYGSLIIGKRINFEEIKIINK